MTRDSSSSEREAQASRWYDSASPAGAEHSPRPPAPLLALLRGLRQYHRHRIFGEADSLDVSGPVIFVGNHSFATYDVLLVGLHGYEATGRWFHGLADRLLFRMPGLRELVSSVGFVEGSREGGLAVLRRGGLLGILPGGMREGLQSSRNRYEVDWRGRYGFVWLSLLSGAPIVLSACPRADDIYDVARLRLTSWVYERFKVPVPLARGLGPTLVPRPVALTHLLSTPILPPCPPEEVTEQIVRDHHDALTRRMTRLMSDALSLDGESPSTLRFTSRGPS